ncbi:ATP-binding protein [Granulosicoccus antarcticus]|uniref:histidine kinase n=1 Tax=Granulosicoccus antarcticus IMCC3135 TaxID=1192854 RepID=A0A2Z2NMP9_9GAMM|nr:ATP-binding protein [Granulosicoccus antarcticus]ASJ72656.1 Blue-light-activated protein [Granulosicoccus antarcticus IMCC3135]
MANQVNIPLNALDQPFGSHQDVHYTLIPYFVGMILWGGFFVYERLSQKQHRQVGDRFLLNSIAFCFLTELLLFTVNALLIEDMVHANLLLPFWPPLQALLVSLCRILIATAFLQLLLKSRTSYQGYLALSLSMLSLAYLVAAPSWLNDSANNTALLFSETSESWFVYGSSAALLMVAVILSLVGSRRRVRLPIAAGLLLIFIDATLNLLRLDIPLVQPIPAHGFIANMAILLLAYASVSFRKGNQRQREQGIQNSERLEALGQLSSGIAHDFNNHLQIILGYVELARNQKNQSTSIDTALDRIEDAADAAGTLVNQLLTFSRGQKTEFTLIDLNELIMGVTPMVSRLLGPDIRIEHDLDLSTSRVNADKRMIEQVFFNLVINARDAMSQGGTILVATSMIEFPPSSDHEETRGLRTRLTISDTGYGMDTQTLRRAFEPFYTTKPVGEGCGLGLATVYGIVQKHGAQVSIETQPGKFTKMHIDFPLPPDTLVEDTKAAILQLTGNGETILLTEDEIAIRDLAKSFLTSSGYRVLVANDGQHAINIVSTYHGQIDLCLFDVIMPRMNGYQAYDKIISQGTSIPALFITGSTSRAEKLRQQHPHLQKPFNSEALLLAVRGVLNQTENV